MTLRTLGFFTYEKLVKRAMRAGGGRSKGVGLIVGRRWSNSTESGGNILKVAKFAISARDRAVNFLR